MTICAKNVATTKALVIGILGLMIVLLVAQIVMSPVEKADCTVSSFGKEVPGKFMNLNFVDDDTHKICCCSIDTSQTMKCECRLR